MDCELGTDVGATVQPIAQFDQSMNQSSGFLVKKANRDN